MANATTYPLRWLSTARDREADAAGEGSAEEKALLRRAQAGDQDAFGKIVQRHWKKAFWKAYDVLYDHGRAQDAAQEAFVKVHRAIQSYDLSRDFSSWLYRIVLNVAIDHKRRSDRDKSTPTDKIEQMVDARAAVMEDEEQKAVIERVDAVLQGLPEKYRVPIVLKDVDGLSVEEIAKVLDQSYSTVRWRLHKGRAMFRERYNRMIRREDRRE
jgi:RNA polymerase sigma-70 factor (ECF subfamily)